MQIHHGQVCDYARHRYPPVELLRKKQIVADAKKRADETELQAYNQEIFNAKLKGLLSTFQGLTGSESGPLSGDMKKAAPAPGPTRGEYAMSLFTHTKAADATTLLAPMPGFRDHRREIKKKIRERLDREAGKEEMLLAGDSPLRWAFDHYECWPQNWSRDLPPPPES